MLTLPAPPAIRFYLNNNARKKAGTDLLYKKMRGSPQKSFAINLQPKKHDKKSPGRHPGLLI